MRALGLAVAIALGPAAAAAASEIVSYAIVQDDGSLGVRGTTIHLFAFYIPSSERACRLGLWGFPADSCE